MKYKSKGKHSVWAVIDLNESKSMSSVNGYRQGVYNVLVTVFEPDNLDNYLKNNVADVIYNKKDESQSDSGGLLTPSYLNDSPFYENSIADGKGTFNSGNEKIRMSRQSDREAVSDVMDEMFAEATANETDVYEYMDNHT